MPVEILRLRATFFDLRLLRDRHELKQFEEQTDTEVAPVSHGVILGMPRNPLETPGMPEAGREIVLERDRITMDLSFPRSSITKDYPGDDVGSFAGTLHKVLSCSDDAQEGKDARFDYRIEAVCQLEQPAVVFLAKRLFPPTLGTLDVRAGSGTLAMNDSTGRTWQVALEPRFNDSSSNKLFLELTLAFESAPLPSNEELMNHLVDLREQLEEIVKSLQGGAE